MDSNQETLQIKITIQEFSSHSASSFPVAFQIKTNHETIKTSSYKIYEGQNQINETLTITLNDQFADSKLELSLLLNNEVAGIVYCNLIQIIHSKLQFLIDNESNLEIEEEVMLNNNQILNPKVKLRLKVLKKYEICSQRTPINLATTQSQQDHNLVLSQLREELDQWKSKYSNLVTELDSLGNELLSLSIKEKGNQFSYLTIEINIFRKIMKSKLQHFLQIYDNQVDQIYLLKKELNSFRSKLCCKCSESLLKHSSQSLSEKISYLTSIIDKKQTEYMQLMKSQEIEKQQQKSLQNTIKILTQQQLQLRQALAKSKKSLEDTLNQYANLEQENKQFFKDITSKAQSIFQLNKRYLELEKQNSILHSDYSEIQDLQKQQILYIIKLFEKEIFEKQQFVESLNQINTKLKFFNNKETINECQAKIEKHIKNQQEKVDKLDLLLNQYRVNLFNQNSTITSIKQFLENLSQKEFNQIEIQNFFKYQIDKYLQNVIEQKDIEITKLKQKIGDMLNLALELGNQILIEQMQLTVM